MGLRTISGGSLQKDADIYLPGFSGCTKSKPVRSDQLPRHFDPPPPSRPLKRATLDELRRGIPETAFLPDGRQRVEDTATYPYSSICSLQIVDEDDRLFYGTGFLAGPRLVLTAGHNVYYDRQFMKQITVTPGLNQNRRNPPFRSAKATRFYSVEAWVYDLDKQFDFGAIVLPTDLGSQAGWLSVSNFTTGTLAPMTVTIAGYPKVPPQEGLPADASSQWHHSGVMSVEPNRLLYQIDTTIGQSGSPLIAFLPEKSPSYHAVGIHNWAFDTTNAATRINPAVFSQIIQWRKLSEQITN